MSKSIIDFRRELEFIDKDLMELLEQRMLISEEIGKYKKEKGLPIEDLQREKAIIEEKLAKSNLSKEFIRKIYSVILEESKRVQREA
jgi:chorismate mutase